MVDLHTIEWMSHKPEEFHMITEEVHEIVKNSPVKNGAVLVLTAHTTTGIMVNEGLPCVDPYKNCPSRSRLYACPFPAKLWCNRK